MSTASREHLAKAELVGNLGYPPELRYTEEQVPYVRMSIATSERYSDRAGEIHERTDWHNCIAWGDAATSIAERGLTKGDCVTVAGNLRINSFEKDGVKHRVTELEVDSLDRNAERLQSRNAVKLVGSVRDAPEVKELDGGMLVARLSIATRTVVNGKDGPKEREDWHHVPLWGRQAEAIRSVTPGSTIVINGALRHETIPADEGQERRISSIKCEKFHVVQLAREQQQRSEGHPRPLNHSAAERSASSGPDPSDGPKPRRVKKGVERSL